MTIGENLRTLRLLSGKTQEQVAGEVGLTRQAISSYESGRTRPDIEMLERLARIYETDLLCILYGDSAQQKALRRMKYGAAGVMIGVLALLLLRSALIYFTNLWLPIEEMSRHPQWMEMRFAVLRVWEAAGGLAQLVWAIGCVVLAIKLKGLRHLPPVGRMGKFAAMFGAGVFLCTVPFAAADPIYAYADYLIVPAGILLIGAAFLLYCCLLYRIRKWGKERGE